MGKKPKDVETSTPRKGKLKIGTGSQLIQQSMSEAVKQFGEDNVYVAASHALHTWGLKVRNLPFEYLIGGADIIPMQRVIGVIGPKGSGKSALMMEISKWFTANDYLAALIETEQKSSYSLLESFYRDMPDKINTSMLYAQANSVENWQQHVQFWVSKVRELKEKENTITPMLIWVDSLTGKGSESSKTYLEEEGQAQGKTFQDTSLVLANFFRNFDIGGLPITFGYVCHVKQDFRDPNGKAIRKVGGVQADYASTLDIQSTIERTPIQYKSLNLEGHYVYLKCIKTCLGPDSHQIKVGFLWRFEKGIGYDIGEGGKKIEKETSIQRTWFDWDGAVCYLLEDMKSDGGVEVRDAIMDLVGLTCQSNFSWSSSKLGLTKVVPSEIGAAIHANEDLYSKLQEILHITRARSFVDRFTE